MKRIEYDAKHGYSSPDVKMKEKGKKNEEVILPADYFDMMAGTDLGGYAFSLVYIQLYAFLCNISSFS